MSLRLTILALILAATSAVAGELRYVGSSTIGRFMADAARVYGASTFDIHVRPESEGGERCPQVGTCDLGGVARELSRTARSNGVEGTLIGRDAIAVIVHPDNPVRDLSPEQIRGMFTGTIRSWSQVGGPEMPVRPFIVDWNSATGEVFRDALLQGQPYAGCEIAVPDARVLPWVAREPGAIGQISASFLLGVRDVRPVTIDGQAPVPGNPWYPVTRPLYLTTAGRPRGETAAFIRWVLSEDGQAVVKRRFAGVP